MKIPVILVGSGLSLTDDSSRITIQNTSLNTDVHLNHVGSNTSTNIVVTGTGPNLAVRGLTGGYGIGIVTFNNDIVVRSHRTCAISVRPHDVTTTSGQSVILMNGTVAL